MKKIILILGLALLTISVGCAKDSTCMCTGENGIAFTPNQSYKKFKAGAKKECKSQEKGYNTNISNEGNHVTCELH